MDSRLKKKIDEMNRQLDQSLKAIQEGTPDFVIKKRKPRKKIPKRKEEQFERIKEKFNDWVDHQTSIKSHRLNIHPDNKEAAYEEMRISQLIPRKEERSASDFSAGNKSKKHALANIEHAINRMKVLMSKKGQLHKTHMGKEAFLTAFNYPTGSAEYNQMRKAIMSLSSEEWEEFAWNNRKLIGKIWDWYHATMAEVANGVIGGPWEMLAARYMPIAFSEKVLANIAGIKTASAVVRRKKIKALTGINIPTAKNNPITKKAKATRNKFNPVKRVNRAKTTTINKVKNTALPGRTTVRRLKRIKKKLTE